VNEAARVIWRRAQRTVGWFIPTNGEGDSDELHIETLPGPDDITRRELANGIVVLVRENPFCAFGRDHRLD